MYFKWIFYLCMITNVSFGHLENIGSWVMQTSQMLVVVVQWLSHVQFFVTPWTAACQASPPITISPSLIKLMSIESVIASNHFILCRPLLSSVFPSIGIFSNESALHITWPKYWRFSLSISPFNEYSGLISFRIDRFDLLAVQGTLKSLQQFKTVSNTTVQKHQFFSAQLSLYFNFHICTWLLEKW